MLGLNYSARYYAVQGLRLGSSVPFNLCLLRPARQ